MASEDDDVIILDSDSDEPILYPFESKIHFETVFSELVKEREIIWKAPVKQDRKSAEERNKAKEEIANLINSRFDVKGFTGEIVTKKYRSSGDSWIKINNKLLKIENNKNQEGVKVSDNEVKRHKLWIFLYENYEIVNLKTVRKCFKNHSQAVSGPVEPDLLQSNYDPYDPDGDTVVNYDLSRRSDNENIRHESLKFKITRERYQKKPSYHSTPIPSGTTDDCPLNKGQSQPDVPEGCVSTPTSENTNHSVTPDIQEPKSTLENCSGCLQTGNEQTKGKKRRLIEMLQAVTSEADVPPATFGKLVAKSLRKMAPLEAVSAQQEIYDILCKHKQ